MKVLLCYIAGSTAILLALIWLNGIVTHLLK
jgi:hypothetical protein